jgi:hypothetical protein
MNINHKLIAALTMATLTNSVHAFDISTHAAMTTEAIKQSKITGDPNSSLVLKKLGLYNKDDVFKERYIDIGTSLTSRNGTRYENDVMDSIRGKIAGTTIPTPYTIPGWIIRGSIREDDNTQETPLGNANGSGDEPGGVFQRVYGHFFDPVNDRGLTVAPRSLGPKSTDWALTPETEIPYTPFANPVTGKNHYNIPSAREAMWRALTFKTRIFNDLPFTSNAQGFDSPAEQKEDERNAYWATMFRSIGDVVHLLQDAAQPQHTRNDAHSGLGCASGTDTCAFGHASFFENYLAARTLQASSFRLAEGLFSAPLETGRVVRTTAPQLIYSGYTPPTFTHFSDYFSTDTGGGNASGKGLANYSNRGFFSFGTNIGNTSYPLPNASALTYSDITGPTVKDMSGNVVGGGLATITFRNGSVTDAVTGVSEPNVKLSTEGVWDQFLIQKGQAPQYTLNYYNYDDQARLLIPRAVGYSAGLIDYFFRGELEISLPDEGVYAVVDYSKESTKDTGGFNKVKLKLTNKTPSISPSGGGATVEQKLLPSGTIVAIAKFRRNKCYIENTLQGEIPVLIKNGKTAQKIFDDCRDKVEEIVVSDPVTLPRVLAYNDIEPLTFNFRDRIPINVMDLYLQVVYRGQLGDETDAVVVGTKDVSEPTFIKISEYRAVYDSGGCKFVNPPNAATFSSAFKIAFTTAASSPFVVEAGVNGTEYSMVAVVSDNSQIKGRAEAVPNKYDPPITLQYLSTAIVTTPVLNAELDVEAQPVSETTTAPFISDYRKSQWSFTDVNTITLDVGVAVEITNVGGMFIDFGFFVDNFDQPNACTPAQISGANTKFHSLYPPYSPVVPKMLKKVTF